MVKQLRNEPKRDAAPGEETFKVVLSGRHADWVRAMAASESAYRRRAITPERMLEIIVREAYAADPTKGGSVGTASSGRQVDFNPAGGSWNG